MHILINNQPVNFDHQDFPLLIHGREEVGASLFTIHVMLQLFRQGHKILFFTGFPAAKEDFRTLLTEEELQHVEFVGPEDAIDGRRAVILTSGEQGEFLRAMRELNGEEDRILLVKNIEEYDAVLFNAIKNRQMLVVSGDTDQVSFLEDLAHKKFATRIFFSVPEKYHVEGLPELQKYQGFAVGISVNGAVALAE